MASDTPTYETFGWETDERWANHFANINIVDGDAAVQAWTIDKIKRRWFHNNVDSSFDPTPPTPQPRPAPEPSANRSAPSSSAPSPSTSAPPPPPQTSSTPPPSQQKSTPPPPASTAPSTPSPITAVVVNRISLICSLAVLFYGVQCVLPFVGSTDFAYTVVYYSALGTYLAWFFYLAGRPQLSRAWFTQWFKAPTNSIRSASTNFQWALFVVIFILNGSLTGAGVIPILILATNALFMVCSWLASIGGAASVAWLPARVSGIVDAGVAKVTGAAQQVQVQIAMGFFFLFPFLLINVFFGGVRLTTVMLFFYFVSLRHRSDQLIQAVFREFSMLLRTKCPAVILPWVLRLETTISNFSLRLVPY